VTKLTTEGKWLPLSAVADGCMVEKKGSVKGIELTYTDDKCLVEVK